MISLPGRPEFEVSKQQWIEYERGAGFTGSGSRDEPSTWSFGGPNGVSGRRVMSVSRETAMSETGRSQSHRAEAGRIAREIHVQGETKYGSEFSVEASVAIGQLHATLALIDALAEIRQVLIAAASR